MSKGRRGRSKKNRSSAPSARSVAVAFDERLAAPLEGESPPPSGKSPLAPEPTLALAPAPAPASAPASASAPAPAPASASASASESDPNELTPPPAGDLDVRFFEESSSETWLAHELELRDPQFVQKMTVRVARRRAHLARYVVGVVGVAAALCLAALVKSAVPTVDESAKPRPSARMAMPPSDPAPEAPLPAFESADPASNAKVGAADGGAG